MRIAVSGAHQTGKTTLVTDLASALPGYDQLDEPYYLLEEAGHVFAETPGLDEFELQLETSIRSVLESPPDCILDRCPLDLVAYLAVHEDSGSFDAARWVDPVREAMHHLDLVVFVPVENPDRIDAVDRDSAGLRRRVDEALYGLVVADEWDCGVPVVQVSGTPGDRTRQVRADLRRRADRHPLP